MKIVGLAGGLASGKDTVAALFAEHSVKSIDADVISRELTADGNPAVADIIAHFDAATTQSIAKENGGIDRAKLRDIVFRDKQELKWLEDYLHPLIRDGIRDRIEDIASGTTRDNMQQEGDALADSDKSTYCLLIAPLLLETGLCKTCDKIIVIDVQLEQQIERACRRDQEAGMTRDIAEKIINSQLAQDAKLKLGDYILDNSGDESLLPAQVLAIHQQLIHSFAGS